MGEGNDVVIYLPVAGKLTALQLGYVTDGHRFDMLGSTWRDASFDERGVTHNVHVAVTVNGHSATLRAEIDGKPYLEHSAKVSDIRLFSWNWEVSPSDHIGLATADLRRLSSPLELTMSHPNSFPARMRASKMN